MKNLFCAGCAILLVASLNGCIANTTPTSRIHAAAGVPRFVDVDDFLFRERPADKGRIGANFGFGYGPAWSDVGNVYGANILHAGVHYRAPTFAIGWTPFLSIAKVSHEGTGGWGSTGWFSVPFGGGNEWRYSAQGSLAGVNKMAEDRGCARANISLFYSDCYGQPQSVSRTEVSVVDVALTLTAEKRAAGNDSFLFSPALHRTVVTSSNHLDVDPAGDVHRRGEFWSPVLQLGYVARTGESLTTVFLLGAERTKTFRPDREVREWMFTGDVRLQF